MSYNAAKVIPTQNKINAFLFFSATYKKNSGDCAVISSEVQRSQLRTPINNSPCQFFIQGGGEEGGGGGWNNHSQRKLCTSKQKIKPFRFLFIAKKDTSLYTVIICTSHSILSTKNLLCVNLTLFVVQKQFFFCS